MEITAQGRARCLIDQINQELTLDKALIGTRFEALVSNCLEILSSQLYTKSTHFLLELIQNADDNTYDCLTPTLSFSYKPGSLRIDCNEVGFTAANVEAVCAISQSTKSGKTNYGDSIGEKGIGFKSVFKAADVVWISSREFTFKFDKKKSLGMVTPIWADFPEPTQLGYTSMYLQLSKDYDEAMLVQELLMFDSNLLIFLRRIQEINIRVTDQDSQVWEKKIRKVEQQQGEDRAVVLHSGESVFRYLIRTHVIKDLPEEKKRPKWHQTKLLIAFPTFESLEKPQLNPQNVYAFLPIRNYGLKFLVQGDFLLTANREDIESTVPWNRKIRDAFVEAFLFSIELFNEGPMKYIWPYYLPSTSTAECSFFEPAITTILTQLKKRPVLESSAGTMVNAAFLKHVPLKLFADEKGVPFTVGPHTAAGYLSPKYPEWAIEAISSIGVSELSPKEFLEHLRSAVTQDPMTFYSRSASWHSQLANTLVKLGTDTELMSMIQDISIIPLCDGNWTSARGKTILFSKGESSLNIPSGIEVLIVDADAEVDPNRYRLFMNLGVKAWEAAEICRIILKMHECPKFDPKTLTTAQLVSHAAFLYKASWQPPKTADLWFATMQDERCLGRKLYIPGRAGKDSATARIFDKLKKQFPVIHDNYLTIFPSDEDWIAWLIGNLGLCMIPRLIDPQIDPKPQSTQMSEMNGSVLPEGYEEIFDEDPLNRHNKVTLAIVHQGSEDINGISDAAATEATAQEIAASEAEVEAILAEEKELAALEVKKTRRGGKLLRKDIERYNFLTDNAATRSQKVTQEQVAQEAAADFDFLNRARNVTESSTSQPPMQNDIQSDQQRLGQPASPLLDSINNPLVEPQRPRELPKLIFKLSEEFKFIFDECDASDILQLLKDNWKHYSQWIDGAHMAWQTSDFVESSANLRRILGACQVKCSAGSLPLQETILPMLDPELEEGCRIPSLNIKDPLHPEWSFLNFFNVIVKADVDYYLRCLISMSQDFSPEIDKVTYIYEKIQEKFKGNKELITAAFRERDIIFLHSELMATELNAWTNMEACLSKSISVESKYPSSSYLFRCLASPEGDPIAARVAAANLITTSTKLEDISRFFRDVSEVLKDINDSKATQLLRPLQRKPIFPVTVGPGKYKYDKLLDLRDTSWFVADRPLIWKSFHGKVPLLALPIEDLAGLDHLFRVLRLDGRMLSKHVKSRATPRGRVNPHREHTASFCAKSPFLKALVPHSHSNKAAILQRISRVRVRTAAEILQTFTLDIPGFEIHGNPVPGEVSLSNAGNMLDLFLKDDCGGDKYPPYELVRLLQDILGIKDPNHYSLLYMVLSNPSMDSILSAFNQQGIRPDGPIAQKSENKPRGPGSGCIRIPLPSQARFSNMASFRNTPDAIYANPFQSRRRGQGVDDRRLPMVRQTQAAEPVSYVVVTTKLYGWEELQQLGEHMASKMFQMYLGSTYDPERDWTSRFRSRSGYKLFENLTHHAAFTMRHPETRHKMTEFLIRYGRSQNTNWKQSLQKNRPVYHLDLVVNSMSKSSSFAITSSQIERMRQFQMHKSFGGSKPEISVLVRVSDVYSNDCLSIDILVDPWHLFNENRLSLEHGWLFKGTLTENATRSPRRRPKSDTPAVSWGMAATPRTHANHSMSLRDRKNQDIYAYKTLSQGAIRLLHLLPGVAEDPLRGVITQVPYKSAGAYRALSYVWGTDERSEELLTPDGVLRITDSLNKSLRRVRHQEKPIMIWVDAICINQEDNKEKAQQIRLLPEIFQSTEATYAAIEDFEGSDAVIEMLTQVQIKAVREERRKVWMDRNNATETERENHPGWDRNSEHQGHVDKGYRSRLESWLGEWPKDLPKVPESWQDKRIPSLDDGIWAHVKTFFSASWFRRMWIIQETVATSELKLVCGKWTIGWDELYYIMEIVDHEVQLADDDQSHLQSSWEPFMTLATQREWETRGYRWNLFNLLESFRYAESTLCRDHFFALLGLASDGNEAEFEPDYDSALEVIVLKFARVFVRQGRGMQLLYRAGLNDQSHRFPSWTPDWTIKRPSSLHDSSENGNSFAAGGPQEPKIKCSPDTDELVVGGYAVDVIESISQWSNVELEWENYFKEVDGMVDAAVLSSVRESRQELKWKVPIACMLDPKVGVALETDMKSSYVALRQRLDGRGGRGKGKGKGKGKAVEANGHFIQGNDDSADKQSAGYITALKDTLYGWRFVVTKRGYVGVVPSLAQVGDAVAVLKGGRVPFILQKSSSRPGAFRLVGECYIHGIMNGEGLSSPDVTEDEFRLH